MTDDTLLDTLASSRYAQLRTRRRDGSAVDTPMWFRLDGDTLIFRTKIGPKTRRLTADPRVELWPCDYRGRYADGPATVGGMASILDGEAAESANRELHRRYGWQYNLVPLLKSRASRTSITTFPSARNCAGRPPRTCGPKVPSSR
jgi:PPOX class probable F420-dependent enzyme